MRSTYASGLPAVGPHFSGGKCYQNRPAAWISATVRLNRAGGFCEVWSAVPGCWNAGLAGLFLDVRDGLRVVFHFLINAIELGDCLLLVPFDDGALCGIGAVSYTHLRAHETPEHLVCRLLLE